MSGANIFFKADTYVPARMPYEGIFFGEILALESLFAKGFSFEFSSDTLY